MRKKMKILFFFAVFFLIFSSLFYSQEKPELLVWIESSTGVKLDELSEIQGSKILNKEDLKDELYLRYNEVWASDKSQWPECIRKVFENLKKYEIIIIKWELDERLQKPYYQGDYDAKGSFTFGYSMKIKNVYAEKFHESDHAIAEAKLDKKRINTNMWFKTSGVLLHEMLHMALQRNQYSKEVRNNKGEVVDSYTYEPKVEDCTSLIFNHAVRFYDLKGENAEKDVPDDCTCENKKDQYKKKGTACGLMGSPGNDHADENTSFSSENITGFSINSNALVYMNGYFEEMNALSGGVFLEGVEPAQKLLDVSPLLIIPSGGLYGKEHDAALKLILAEYVRLGGNLLVLSQQANSHYAILPGCGGTPLVGYGWASDQSCDSASSYYENMNPAISAFFTWAGRGSVNTDGYFEEFGENCTVLLRRTKNRKPLAMVYYPYEDENSGAILVTSMFTDWAAAHGQASITEKRLVRDFVTFMKNARKPMPLVCWNDTPNPSLQLSVNMKNNPGHTASKYVYFRCNINYFDS